MFNNRFLLILFEAANKLAVLKIKMKWQCLTSVPLFLNNVEQTIDDVFDYAKFLKVTALTNGNKRKILIDIRNYTKEEKATRIGVCIYPNEFRWIANRLIKDKIGVKQFGNRTIVITKSSKNAFNIALNTPYKHSDIWLNDNEVNTFKENYTSVRNLVNLEKLDKIEDFQDLNLDIQE